MIEKRKPGRPRKSDPHNQPSNWPETEARRVRFLAMRPGIEAVAKEHGLAKVAVDAFDAYGQIALAATYQGKRHAVRLPVDTLHLPHALADKLKGELDAQAQGAGVGEASERPQPQDIGARDGLGVGAGSIAPSDTPRPVGHGFFPDGEGGAGLQKNESDQGVASGLGLAVTGCEPGAKGSELAALHAEAWDAFDLDRPTGKTDSLGRIWAFDVEIKGGVKTVDLSVRRVGGLKHGTKIEVPVLDFQGARPVVEQIVNRLNGELL